MHGRGQAGPSYLAALAAPGPDPMYKCMNDAPLHAPGCTKRCGCASRNTATACPPRGAPHTATVCLLKRLKGGLGEEGRWGCPSGRGIWEGRQICSPAVIINKGVLRDAATPVPGGTSGPVQDRRECTATTSASACCCSAIMANANRNVKVPPRSL